MIRWRAHGTSALAAWLPLAGAVATLAIVLPLSPPYDLRVFLRAGHDVLHGLALYPVPGTRAVYSGWAFVYPYFTAWLFAPLALLPASTAAAAFLALSAGAILAAGLVAAETGMGAVALVLGSSFVITGLQLGALSPLLVAGAVWLWRVRDRPVAFGLLAAVVVGAKLFLAPLLLWPLAARRGRALTVAGAALVVLLGTGFLAGPLGANGYISLLGQLGTHEARAGFGVIGALRNLGLGGGEALSLAALLAGGVCAASYGAYRRAGDERVLYCAGLVTSLLLSPVVWSHYLALAAAGLLVLRARTRWFLALAVASWVLAPPHGVHSREIWTGGPQLTALWVTAVLCLVWWFSAGSRTSLPGGRWEAVRDG